MRQALIIVLLACGAMGCATTEYGERAKYAGVRCEDGKRALYAFQKCRPPASASAESESEVDENDDSVGPST
jgi:hypothetical protein